MREEATAAPARLEQNSPAARAQVRRLAVLTLVLAACFAKPLYGLVMFAAHSDLFSHILLIPFISIYLVWIRKDSLPQPTQPATGLVFAAAAAGAATLLGYSLASHNLARAPQDYLA